jgi:C1A family cysteine protease
MDETINLHKFGWLRDRPDCRDYTAEHKAIEPLLRSINAHQPQSQLPGSTDLRVWCSPIEDQKDLGSCTAQAVVGVIEYWQRRENKSHIEGSRLFLYKVTRNLMHVKGDTGAYIRTTFKAAALFGTPPEDYHPYDITHFDSEPSAFCYAYAQNNQALSYYRLDTLSISKASLLETIKAKLAAGFPIVFGFTVYSSYNQAQPSGKIPYPTQGEKVVGGHAVVAVGYNDAMIIKNSNPTANSTKGALLIRNSWGKGWGESGYGWLPYDYVTEGQAVDWWVLVKNEWLDPAVFER